MFNMTYLRHDVDAAHDPKTVGMMSEYGRETYTDFWLLMEVFGRSSNGFVDLGKPGQRGMLAREMWVTDEELDGRLSILAESGLIDAGKLSEGKVMSNSFLQRRDEMKTAYENGCKGGRPRKNQGVKG